MENIVEREHKEIDLIQNCIERMAHNSFIVKGWTIALFTAIIALVPNTENNTLILSIVVLTISFSFWVLDGFFLSKERRFIKLYNDVIKKREKGDLSDFYSLNIAQYKDCKDCKVVFAMCSPTLICFYALLIVMNIMIYVYRYFAK